MKSYLEIVLLFLITLTLKSQVNEEWVRRHDGPLGHNDAMSEMILDNNGNPLVTGQVLVVHEQDPDYCTIKYSPAGNVNWVRTYNSGQIHADWANAIASYTNGNVCVTGSSIQNNSGDIVTLLYDGNGNLLWDKRFQRSADEIGTNVSFDSNGDIIVVGYRDVQGVRDVIVLKYSQQGILLWETIYNSPNNLSDHPQGSKTDINNNIYLACTSGYEVLILKISSTGALIYDRYYDFTSNLASWVHDMDLDIQNNIYLTGFIQDSSNQSQMLTAKINDAGNVIWSRVLSGGNTYYNKGKKIKLDNSGNIIVLGDLTYMQTRSDIATLKYDNQGNLQWIKTYINESGQSGNARDLALDKSNNIYITGEVYYLLPGNTDFVTIKYDPQGERNWLIKYNGPGDSYDYPHSIAVDSTYKVYVSGNSVGSSNDFEWVTIKYNQVIGITQISNNIPLELRLHSNFPNPFNPSTEIRFDIPQDKSEQNIVLKVYDINGKEVSVLVNQNLSAGTYEVTFNSSGLTSGIYFYSLETGSFRESRKMILLK